MDQNLNKSKKTKISLGHRMTKMRKDEYLANTKEANGKIAKTCLTGTG